jgi:hypothetical protein
MNEREQIEKLRESFTRLGLSPLALSGLPLMNTIPICEREGHHLIPDENDSYVCRYCAKRFIEKPSEQPG